MSSTRGADRDVAVVVPTRNSSRTIEACLRSIRSQSVPCPVVVVDNESTDRTRALAECLADLVIEAGGERCAQRNRGAEAMPARVLGFIDSDMILDPRVAEEAVRAIDAGAVAVVVPERTVGTGYWCRVRAFERSFYEGSEHVEAARFFRGDVFASIGGWDEQMIGGEDWDLTIRARRLGPVVRIDAVIEHDEGRVHYFDAVRKKGYYAPGLQRFATKHGTAVLRQSANRPWLRQPRALCSPLGAGLIALKTGEAVSVTATLLRSNLGRHDDARALTRVYRAHKAKNASDTSAGPD
ncbi:MAG: glycosyltransferase family 2 protein [Acidimicrobiales bacterium]